MTQLTTLGYILSALLMLGVLIMAHEAGHFWVARRCGIEVKEFAIGMGPKVWSRKGKRGTLFSLRALPLGGFCLYYGEDQEMEDPRAYNNQRVWKRFLSVLAGPAMNFLLALTLAVAAAMIWGTRSGEHSVYELTPGMPAMEAGIEPGDVLLAIDGLGIAGDEAVSALIRNSGGRTLEFLVRREGGTLALPVTPVLSESSGVYQVGFVYGKTWLEHPPLGLALANSVLDCKDAVALTYRAFADLLFRGQGAEELSGPVGIVNVIQQETRAGGLPVYLKLAMLISINLGFMNLLPIPGLDGSRLIFHIVETVRRKPVNRNVEGFIHLIGVVALLGVMLLFTYKDILRIFLKPE